MSDSTDDVTDPHTEPHIERAADGFAVFEHMLKLIADPQTFAKCMGELKRAIEVVADGETKLAADRALHWSRGVRKHLGLIERVGGVVLVAMGILLLTGQLTLINIWAIRTFGLGLAL